MSQQTDGSSVGFACFSNSACSFKTKYLWMHWQMIWPFKSKISYPGEANEIYSTRLQFHNCYRSWKEAVRHSLERSRNHYSLHCQVWKTKVVSFSEVCHKYNTCSGGRLKWCQASLACLALQSINLYWPSMSRQQRRWKNKNTDIVDVIQKTESPWWKNKNTDIVYVNQKIESPRWNLL